MRRTNYWARLIALCAFAPPGIAFAHHTYSMFDTSRQLTVSGVVAKFEWKNPHTYLWVYVPDNSSAGKYELWAFENGSPSLLSRLGWSKESLKANDNVTVTYAPLRDGKPGGHCVRVKLPDGRNLECQGFGAGPAGPGR